MTKVKSNETFRLICRDADAIVFEVESNAKRIDELYVVRLLENSIQITSNVAYIVSGNEKIHRK